MSKSYIFLMKSFLGNFYRHLAIFFWSHWPQSQRTIGTPACMRVNTYLTRGLGLKWSTSLFLRGVSLLRSIPETETLEDKNLPKKFSPIDAPSTSTSPWPCDRPSKSSSGELPDWNLIHISQHCLSFWIWRYLDSHLSFQQKTCDLIF